MTDFRQCSVCGSDFEFVRTVGRPPEKCGVSCRRVAARRNHRRYIRRLIDARDQLGQLGQLAA